MNFESRTTSVGLIMMFIEFRVTLFLEKNFSNPQKSVATFRELIIEIIENHSADAVSTARRLIICKILSKIHHNFHFYARILQGDEQLFSDIGDAASVF
jgi:hypothetical protein